MSGVCELHSTTTSTWGPGLVLPSLSGETEEHLLQEEADLTHSLYLMVTALMCLALELSVQMWKQLSNKQLRIQTGIKRTEEFELHSKDKYLLYTRIPFCYKDITDMHIAGVYFF